MSELVESAQEAVDAHERAHPVAKACTLLGDLSRSQFYEELKSGRLVARKIGSRTVVLDSEITRYLRALPVAGDE